MFGPRLLVVSVLVLLLGGCASPPAGPATGSDPSSPAPSSPARGGATTTTPSANVSSSASYPTGAPDPTAHKYYYARVILVTNEYWVNSTGTGSNDSYHAAETGPHCVMTSYEMDTPSFNLTYYMDGEPPQPGLVLVRDYDNHTVQPFPTTSESPSGVARQVGDGDTGAFDLVSPFNASRIVLSMQVNGDNVTIGNTTVGPGQLFWRVVTYSEEHQGTSWAISERITVRPLGSVSVNTHTTGTECV